MLRQAQHKFWIADEIITDGKMKEKTTGIECRLSSDLRFTGRGNLALFQGKFIHSFGALWQNLRANFIQLFEITIYE